MEYKIDRRKGYSPQISFLVSQMDYARKTTLDSVKGLTSSELDFLPCEGANSIGALLLHMAAVEKGFQIELFDERRPNEQEMTEWGAAYSLGEEGRKNIKGYSLEFYLTKLDEIRRKTLQEFSERNDEWLFESRVWDNQPSNHYFIWFHVFEDEINHRGQIRLIRRILSEKNKS
ncbi:DinB family protein [Rossellomorea vietnamensis]|uniref:Integrase n=1 Tax=Rossellomorea vietnamensis TaxID=218284 RepID=A0A0P6WCZ4_9BACI|nr:DinB family protein [Rossellomorea vietnamensis]KPL58859.1 integrase [Rossellomorea vietnamensis]